MKPLYMSTPFDCIFPLLHYDFVNYPMLAFHFLSKCALHDNFSLAWVLLRSQSLKITFTCFIHSLLIYHIHQLVAPSSPLFDLDNVDLYTNIWLFCELSYDDLFFIPFMFTFHIYFPPFILAFHYPFPIYPFDLDLIKKSKT